MLSRSEYDSCPDISLVAEEIVTSHSSTRSGVRFMYAAYGQILLTPPEPEVDIPPDELLTQYQKKLFMDDATWERFADKIGIEKLLSQARTAVQKEFIGGVGITARQLKDVEYEIPGIGSRLKRETGRITFLGNGLSPVPAAIAQRYADGVINDPPVIVDIFDYYDLLLDLEGLIVDFHCNKLKLPLQKEYQSIRSLVDAMEEGNLIAVRYQFGTGSPPPELREAKLAINCIGPNSASFLEQLSVLAPGGELYTTEGRNGPLPQNFKEFKLQAPNQGVSFKYLRVC